MNKIKETWQDFPLKTRVEVRIEKNKWIKGIVVGTPQQNKCAIIVKCDKKWHYNLDFYEGHGASILINMRRLRYILWNIRKIKE